MDSPLPAGKWKYRFSDPGTYWWDLQTATPFAQVIGEIPPNRSEQQFYKLTSSPSRAAAAGVSYDFGDSAQILNPCKIGNCVLHKYFRKVASCFAWDSCILCRKANWWTFAPAPPFWEVIGESPVDGAGQ